MKATLSKLHKPVSFVDIRAYAGRWYVIGCIPAYFDKGRRETMENYSLNPKGYYDVLTRFKRADDDIPKTLESKLYFVEGKGNAEMKVQTVWPFKSDYWVIELAKDYSYAVIGHPEYKFLHIMSREMHIDRMLFLQILTNCQLMGYDTDKIEYPFETGFSRL